MELKIMYSNIKKIYASLKALALFKPPMINAQTVIIYSLKGAMAFYAILEDKCRLSLSFKRVIYDPRGGQPENRGVSSTLIDWEMPSFMLYRTKYQPDGFPAQDPEVIQTVFHLMKDYTWKPFKTYSQKGPSRRIIVTEDLVLSRYLEDLEEWDLDVWD